MRLATTILILLILIIVLPFTMSHRETTTVEEARSKSAWGEHIPLSKGITHYELSGPVNGPIVVLVHGGTVPAFSWDKQLPAFWDAGYRVLRYDQYGRGTSDRPDLEYDRALYIDQLSELLTKLALKEPVHLVGISFGGATSANYAAHHPDQVKTLTLLAPVYDYAEGKALLSLANLPGVGEWYVRVLGVPKMLKRGQQFLENVPESWEQQFVEQTRYEGFERSLLSMVRSGALGNYESAFKKTADKPLLLVWGDQDKEIPKQHIEQIRSINKKSLYLELAGIDHNPNSAAPNKVNQAIIEFIKAYELKHRD